MRVFLHDLDPMESRWIEVDDNGSHERLYEDDEMEDKFDIKLRELLSQKQDRELHIDEREFYGLRTIDQMKHDAEHLNP